MLAPGPDVVGGWWRGAVLDARDFGRVALHELAEGAGREAGLDTDFAEPPAEGFAGGLRAGRGRGHGAASAELVLVVGGGARPDGVEGGDETGSEGGIVALLFVNPVAATVEVVEHHHGVIESPEVVAGYE